MDKRQQRTQRKMNAIIRTALELFAKHGYDKISMDEIAEAAHVSKVTIYKYFESKENLYTEVIEFWIEETLSEIEAVLNSDRDYLDKLKFMLTAKSSSTSIASFDTLYQIWEQNSIQPSIQDRIKGLMKQFYDEGREKGLIHDSVTFETLFLYAEIFRAGMKATILDQNIPIDKQTLDDLIDVYFFGIIKRND